MWLIGSAAHNANDTGVSPFTWIPWNGIYMCFSNWIELINHFTVVINLLNLRETVEGYCVMMKGVKIKRIWAEDSSAWSILSRLLWSHRYKLPSFKQCSSERMLVKRKLISSLSFVRHCESKLQVEKGHRKGKHDVESFLPHNTRSLISIEGTARWSRALEMYCVSRCSQSLEVTCLTISSSWKKDLERVSLINRSITRSFNIEKEENEKREGRYYFPPSFHFLPQSEYHHHHHQLCLVFWWINSSIPKLRSLLLF